MTLVPCGHHSFCVLDHSGWTPPHGPSRPGHYHECYFARNLGLRQRPYACRYVNPLSGEAEVVPFHAEMCFCRHTQCQHRPTLLDAIFIVAATIQVETSEVTATVCDEGVPDSRPANTDTPAPRRMIVSLRRRNILTRPNDLSVPRVHFMSTSVLFRHPHVSSVVEANNFVRRTSTRATATIIKRGVRPIVLASFHDLQAAETFHNQTPGARFTVEPHPPWLCLRAASIHQVLQASDQQAILHITPHDEAGKFLICVFSNDRVVADIANRLRPHLSAVPHPPGCTPLADSLP